MVVVVVVVVVVLVLVLVLVLAAGVTVVVVVRHPELPQTSRLVLTIPLERLQPHRKCPTRPFILTGARNNIRLSAPRRHLVPGPFGASTEVLRFQLMGSRAHDAKRFGARDWV